VIGPDAQAPLADGENILGRGPDSVLWIDDDTVSRRHARIRVEKESAILEDLGSYNGTFVGRRRLVAPVALCDGDEIRLGSLKIRYRASGSDESTRSTPAKRRERGPS
jgi:pSer/pThr/pTyr-binding forkhead associated (FHA) protein